MKEIIIAGRIGRHQQDRIISTEWICPALTAGSHLNAGWMNLILEVYEEDFMRVERQGGAIWREGLLASPAGTWG